MVWGWEERTATVGAGVQVRPRVGFRNSPVRCCSVLRWCCLFHPISLVLPKETGWSPKEKRLGWWRPREVSGPARLSHSRGSCHSAAKVSASRTDWITRPRGEGFGLAEVSPSKSFLPRFFTKKRAGSRGGALAARRSARNAPCAHKAQEGVKGGTLAGGSPFAGGPRRPQPLRRRGADGHPTPGGGGGTPPLRGGWRNAVRPAETVGAGRRGRRPLQGWCDAAGSAIIPRRAGAGGTR